MLAAPKPEKGYAVLTWRYVRVWPCARKDPAAAHAALTDLQAAVKATTDGRFFDPFVHMARAQVESLDGQSSLAEADLRAVFPEVAKYPPRSVRAVVLSGRRVARMASHPRR